MIYLDQAATSWPKPGPVIAAMADCMENLGANPGRGEHQMAMEAADLVFEARTRIADLLGAGDPLNIVFTSNCTEALNLGLKGLLEPGDHVVLSPLEHNSVWRPLKALERHGIDLTIAKGDAFGRVTRESVQAALNSRTRLILIIHASNVNGAVNPLGEIGALAHERSIAFMVDAAQSIGHLPIDVAAMAIDLLAFPGHKGLLGPQGTGGLYLSPGLALRPLKEGGTGSESERFEQPGFSPDRYESGTLNTPGIAGLAGGVAVLADRGLRWIQEHEAVLTGRLLEGLAALPGVTLLGPPPTEPRVGVVSFQLRGWDCNLACEALDRRHGIAARGGLHCAALAHQTLGTLKRGTIRFSVGIANTLDQMDAAIAAVDELAGEVSGGGRP